MGIERMTHKFRACRRGAATVRARYAAIAASCLLLAGMMTVAAQQTAGWVMRTMPDSAHFAARVLRWGVNHVGMRPMLVLGFLAMGALLFWLRAGKLDGDLRELSRATRELADGVPMRPAQVLSSGELRELARQLQRVDQRMRAWEGLDVPRSAEDVEDDDSGRIYTGYTPSRPRFGRRF